jgi:tetratricopeptide (TPR) repeat protein
MRLLTITFLVCVFLLGIIKIEDPDTWTHLSLGREIVKLKGFPENEPFTFPSLDKPFYNHEWLFDLIFYIAYALFNVHGVIFLKASIVTAVFFVLLKDSFVQYKNPLVSTAVLIFIVFMVRHRFVERPDIVLMLFLSFTIFSLNTFVHEGKRYLYLLPLIQILWVNMHPSIVLFIIPFGAFIFGGILQGLVNKKYNRTLPFTPSPSQLKTISIIFFLLLAVSFINPYFHKPFLEPFKLTTSDWFMDEITELQSPTWKHYKSPYLLTAAVMISFVLNIRRLSMIYLLLVAPFIYLSFSGLRFMFLLCIIGGPIIARNIASLVAVHSLHSTVHSLWKRLVEGFLIVSILLSTVLAISGIRPFSDLSKVFGFGINYDFSPEGALQYLDKRGITGRIFNTYEWGGYITWRDFPKRSAFVDGRGYLSEDLLEKMGLVSYRPPVLEELYNKYGFESILIKYPFVREGISEALSESEKDLALSNPNWALVYWDDLSLVYLKRGGRYDSLINEDEYRFIKPANEIHGIRAKLHDVEYRTNVFTEIKRNIKETGSSKAYALLGLLYNEIEIGMYKEAIDAFSKVRDFPFLSHLPQALTGIGYAYRSLGNINESIRYFKKSLSMMRDATTLYHLGIAYIKKGEKKTSIKYLKDALTLNSNLISIYPLLIGIYKELGMEEDVRKTMKMYEKVRVAKEGEEHFKNGVSAYLQQRFEVAVEEFKKSIMVNPSNPAPFSNLGYLYFDIGEMERAYEYHKKAIDIDPNFANSHYGLALIYKKWGDRSMAKKHWEEYLRVEPSGYYSRKAKKEIEAIEKEQESSGK